MNPSEPLVKAGAAIKRHMVAGAVAGVVPFPWIGLATLTGVQLNMLRHLASIYGVDFSHEVAKSAIASLVGSDFSLSVSIGFAKLVPGPIAALGAVTGGLMGAASTYALGKLFVQHFESGNTFLTFDPEKVRAHYEQLYKASTSEAMGNFSGIRP